MSPIHSANPKMIEDIFKTQLGLTKLEEFFNDFSLEKPLGITLIGQVIPSILAHFLDDGQIQKEGNASSLQDTNALLLDIYHRLSIIQECIFNSSLLYIEQYSVWSCI